MSDAKSKSQKSILARKRWQILSQALKSNKDCLKDLSTSEASLRRFSSFGLFNVKCLNKMENDGHKWQEYSCGLIPLVKIKIRHLKQKVTVEDLIGFNNTGNVCLWPSEEVLAFYCIKYRKLFKDKAICEIGGGMTSFSGLFVAVASEAKTVLLSDGNSISVNNIDVIVNANKNLFGNTQVNSRQLRWDVDSDTDDLLGTFDYILCSDCLFFNESRHKLAETMAKILKSEANAIVLAPNRSGTFRKFQSDAEKFFEITCLDKYDDQVWNLHLKFQKEIPDLYNEDVCYPLMLKMKKLAK